MRFGRKSVLKTQVFYVRFVKGCLAQNSNIYSEMKMKLLDKTDGNEYIIEYSQSVRAARRRVYVAFIKIAA